MFGAIGLAATLAVLSGLDAIILTLDAGFICPFVVNDPTK
jgi:hypothetical protein